MGVCIVCWQSTTRSRVAKAEQISPVLTLVCQQRIHTSKRYPNLDIKCYNSLKRSHTYDLRGRARKAEGVPSLTMRHRACSAWNSACCMERRVRCIWHTTRLTPLRRVSMLLVEQGFRNQRSLLSLGGKQLVASGNRPKTRFCVLLVN